MPKRNSYHIGLVVNRDTNWQRLYIWHDRSGPGKRLAECESLYMAQKILKALNKSTHKEAQKIVAPKRGTVS